jgi:hypothetical protein
MANFLIINGYSFWGSFFMESEVKIIFFPIVLKNQFLENLQMFTYFEKKVSNFTKSLEIVVFFNVFINIINN